MTTAELEKLAADVAGELRRRALSRRCEWCGSPFVPKSAKGRFCSPRCRIAAHRNLLPVELTSRARWVRWNAEKVPLTVDGDTAKSNDPGTWTAYEKAKASTAGVGVGFVLNGDGICCIDIDNCITNGAVDDRAREIIDATENVFMVEISPSGNGIHIWHHGAAGKGTNRTENGLRVERYSQGRYMTVTGRRLGNHG